MVREKKKKGRIRGTGIPCQISKNWHTGRSIAVEGHTAGHNHIWWTANVLLRLPAESKIDLEFAILYEAYGRVPAWSHAQLSLIGGKDPLTRWVWEEAALGCAGENMVFDPLGL